MEKPIRIICTVTNDLNYDQRMIRICTSLTRAGYEVRLVGRKTAQSTPLKEQVFKQKRLPCYFQKGKLFYLEFNLRLLFYLAFQKTDIICGIDLDTLVPAFLVARLRNKICVYDAHEYFSEVPEVIHRPMTKKVWETVASLIIPKLKYCYTVGEMLSKVFQDQYGVPFSVIRNMPFRQDALVPQPVSNGNEPRILFYQGAVNEGRGIKELIDAMADLEHYQLWIAGDGDLKTAMEQKAAASGYAGRVFFLGKVTPEKLKELTPRAWLGMNLLENKSLNYYYSLANKYFDYVQAGVPVIQMQFPEYQRLNEQFETALLIENLDAPSIVKAVLTMDRDQLLYKKLKTNCCQAAEAWNWENEESVLIEFYNKITLSGKKLMTTGN